MSYLFDNNWNQQPSQDPWIRTVKIFDPPAQHVRIIVESLQLLNTTYNPETYFSRYELALRELLHILDYTYPIYNNLTPGQIYQSMKDDANRDALHREFIDKLFAAHREKALIYQNYEICYKMSQRTREYIVRRFGATQFHFCKVRFSEMSNRLYTYVCKDNAITIGDTITVPTGNGAVPESKVLQVEETYDSSLSELAFPIELLRCVERKLKSVVCPHCGAGIQMYTQEKLGNCCRCRGCYRFQRMN